MTSKQRVQAALAKRPADRVPVFMWFHPETARRLAGLLEIAPGSVEMAMGNDIRQTWVNNNYAMEGIVHSSDGEAHVDDWGIRWVKRFFFNQIEHHPLAGASPDEVEAYRFPYHRMERLLALMQPVVEERGERFIGCDVSPCVFEMYWRLRGMEESMVDLAMRPELASTLLARCADFSIALGEAACSRFGLDWYWTGDDIAGQRSMMMSPALWRRLIRPHLERVFNVGRKRGLPVAYHCCGALRPIIGDLVEMGMTILNPIQCNCPGMDPLELKREFGRELAFMGGVDTQGLLPSGTATEVARATARLIEGMTCDGGGYILAASHTIPPETPDANIFAMYAEAGISREEIFDRAAQMRAHHSIPNGRATTAPH
jgi:uroporphyrinogen decarboxylase